jgi:hypothetical protein
LPASPPFAGERRCVTCLLLRLSQTIVRSDDRSTGPVLVMRYSMYTSTAVNGIPAPGVCSGTVVQEITRLAYEGALQSFQLRGGRSSDYLSLNEIQWIDRKAAAYAFAAQQIRAPNAPATTELRI